MTERVRDAITSALEQIGASTYTVEQGDFACFGAPEAHVVIVRVYLDDETGEEEGASTDLRA